MKPQSPQKFDFIRFILGLLFFGSFGSQAIAGYISIHSTIYHVLQFSWLFFFGIYELYIGIKKLQMRKAKQEQVHWYNQPLIWLAISSFLLLPVFVLFLMVSQAVLDTISVTTSLLLFTPATLCILAAAFFAVRRFLGYQRSKV